MAKITEIGATGDIATDSRSVYSVVLTSAAAASTLQIRSGGSEGTLVLHLESKANESTSASLNAPAFCPGGIHATLTGTGAFATVVHD